MCVCVFFWMTVVSFMNERAALLVYIDLEVADICGTSALESSKLEVLTNSY